jgi:type I restriction enzyme S subunit
MNAADLLRHYARISEAPDAIPKLRRFVLELAVRGKLVEQDAADEPASELLKRIAAEKARLVKAKQAKKLEVEPLFDDDGPHELPSNWAWTRLGSIGDWGAGSTPSRGNSELYGGPVTWLKSGELNDNLALSGSSETVTELAVKKGSFRVNKPGDVLIAMYGATIGKLAILAEVAVTNQAVCGCTPFAGVSNQFLFLFLLSQREQFHAASEGGAQPNISKIKIVTTPFPLSPLAEQHRIVSKVDELMALCDRLEEARTTREGVRDKLTAASLARLTAPETTEQDFQSHARFALQSLPALTTRPDQIKPLRQTILNLAVRGKLVEQDAADEPAGELSKILQSEKTRLVNDGAIRKQKASAALSASEKIFPLPLSWKWTRLLDLGATQTGTSPSSARDELFGDFIPFVKPADLDGPEITYDGFGLSEEGMGHSRVAPANSVMMVCIGGTLGKINCTSRDVCFNQQINSVTPFIGGLHRYISMALKSSYFQDLAWAKAGIGTLPIISKGKWEVLPIPLPPLAEQHRIVAKVDALMALCDRLEASLTTADTTRQRLLTALLNDALNPAEQAMEAAE